MSTVRSGNFTSGSTSSSGDLSEFLCKSSDMLVRASTPSLLVDALEALDAARYSLGACGVLTALLKICNVGGNAATGVEWDVVYNRVVLFIGKKLKKSHRGLKGIKNCLFFR